MASQFGTPVTYREMRADDLKQAHGLSLKERWPHRIQEWMRCLRLGFGVVAIQNEKIVGTAMGWPFNGKIASLGMVIVSADCRGQGVGRKLMDMVIGKLGDRTIVLNSTNDGLPLYKKFGFKETGTIVQHQGASFTAPLIVATGKARIRPLGESDIDDLVRLDSSVVGYERANLMAELVESAQGLILDLNGEVVGYSIFRRFGHGHVIGPTIAPNIEGAKAMISNLLGANPGMFIRLDVPEESGLSDWLDVLGVASVDRVTRMVCGELPQTDNGTRVFSIVNQAFG